VIARQTFERTGFGAAGKCAIELVRRRPGVADLAEPYVRANLECASRCVVSTIELVGTLDVAERGGWICIELCTCGSRELGARCRRDGCCSRTGDARRCWLHCGSGCAGSGRGGSGWSGAMFGRWWRPVLLVRSVPGQTDRERDHCDRDRRYQNCVSHACVSANALTWVNLLSPENIGSVNAQPSAPAYRSPNQLSSSV
jgi:hypothetical protein